MTLHFVTGNTGKLHELQAIIPEIRQLDIDLPEIQHSDAHNIIEAKLQEALKLHDGPLIVEDTSLYLDVMNGLPGPLIKWFLKAIGTEGVYSLAKAMGNTSASARTLIGYAAPNGSIEFFEGMVEGKVVPPRGDDGFGWDEIFQQVGYDKTFAEMSKEQKNELSMRKRAAEQLKNYLGRP